MNQCDFIAKLHAIAQEWDLRLEQGVYPETWVWTWQHRRSGNYWKRGWTDANDKRIALVFAVQSL